MEPSILIDIQQGVAVIRLNRPKVYNSFNREMALALQAALDTCRADKTVRAILLTGNGKAFSAGQDLAEVVAENGPSMYAILAEHYNPVIERIRQIEKPVICAVNGVAAGAGANIALCCDITIAAESASFLQAFSKIGLIPDSGGTFFLPRLIGLQRATALMMLAERVSAADAVAMGMIYKVFPDDTLETEALKMAAQLAAMPSLGLAYTKHVLNQSLTNNLSQQLKAEEEWQVRAGQTEDFQEGVQAFLEKRPPVFNRSDR
ncbi:MAG: enoyl-CoA hydratase/isomerase family protein [Saprospiraceae bacterium]|nr:enoyl-CoA hydratase/isomerase family protein [Saprospiraceae bacterium]